MTLEGLQFVEQQIGQLDQEMASLLRQHQDAVERLAVVPGLGVDSAQQVNRHDQFAADICDVRTADYIELRCRCKNLPSVRRARSHWSLLVIVFTIALS